ncbi:PQQ-binding-like beta-propeller repeat protein [Actinomadura sp. 3N508]|uniref:outer membrane protein assembly factor BamB family protein n=1 Tax=Actinomadura sp. 3N508 TaxID=3375153 RepID=UPI00378EE799
MTRAKKDGRPSKIKWMAIGLAAAAICGLALPLLIRDFIVLGTEAGGSCGTRRGPCPNHWGLIFVLSFFPLLLLIPLACYALYKARPAWIAGLVAAAVCVFPGWLLFDVLHGPTLNYTWSAPHDRGSDTDTEGVWTSGDTVIRAKFDGLTAYTAGTGRQTWKSTLPARDTLCAMSRTVENNVGLIAHEPGSSQCGSIQAIDTTTGKQLWTRTLPAGKPVLEKDADTLTTAGTTGAYRTSETIEAFGLRDGKTLWQKARTSPYCSIGWLAGASNQILIGERCTRIDPTARTTGFSQHVRAFDPATGRDLWKTDLQVIGNATVDLVSATPPVIAVRESDARGKKSLMALDAQGRVTATIPTDDPNGEIDTSPQTPSAVIQTRKIVASGTTLITVTRTDQGEYALAGYSLTDGRQLWATEKDRESIEAITFDGKDVFTLTSHITTLQLRSFDPSTGKQRTSSVVPSRWNDSRATLLPTPSGLLIASSSGRNPYHPLKMLPRP